MAAPRLLLVLIALVLASGVWGFSRSQQITTTVRPPVQKADRPAAASPARLKSQEEIAAALKAGDRVAFSQAFSRLAGIDPRVAAALLNEAGAFREDAMRCLAQVWGKSDLNAARDWAVSLPEAGDREHALTYICFAVAEADPGRALRFAQKEGLNDQTGTIRNLAQQWAVRDFATAREWALAIPGGPERDMVFQRLVLARADSAPEEAGALVVAEIPAGPAQDEAVMSVLNRWLRRDAVAAAAWISGFPDSDLKSRAEQEIANATGEGRGN
jgi:hypothetical protein